MPCPSSNHLSIPASLMAVSSTSGSVMFQRTHETHLTSFVFLLWSIPWVVDPSQDLAQEVEGGE